VSHVCHFVRIASASAGVFPKYRELAVNELRAATPRHRVGQKRVVEFAKRQLQRLRPAGKHHLSAERVAGAGASGECLAGHRLESKPRGSGEARPCFVQRSWEFADHLDGRPRLAGVVFEVVTHRAEELFPSGIGAVVEPVPLGRVRNARLHEPKHGFAAAALDGVLLDDRRLAVVLRWSHLERLQRDAQPLVRLPHVDSAVPGFGPIP
jgi:hypothetical protein